MQKIEESFSVFGLSRFGSRVASLLFQQGANVIVMDRDEGEIHKIADEVTKAICVDVTDWDAVTSAGGFNVDVAIIALRHAFDTAVLLTNYIKNHTKIKKVVAQVDSEEKVEVLKLIGADIIVFPENDMAERIVKKLIHPELAERIDLSPKTAVIEVEVPEHFIGKSIVELEIRKKYNVYVIGIMHPPGTKKGEKDLSIAPSPQIKFQRADKMILIGESENLRRFISKIKK